MPRIARWALLCLILPGLPGIPVSAQQTLGSINGTVKDASGAVVPGAKVTVRNTGTNLELTSTTNNEGSFSLVDLPLGTCAVTLAAEGFKNLFNGNSSGQVGENRVVLNTGENFGSGGGIQSDPSAVLAFCSWRCT